VSADPPAGADAERARTGADAIARLDEITRRLRRDCPWDRVQDERSIVPHTVEESYELADAAASGDDEKMLDELGDVLFQVHFLSLLLEERGAGDLAAVAEGTRAKLIRRHPHVFGEASAADAEEVLGNWDRIKREQEGRDGLFTDIPENLPALLLARKVQRRAASRAPEGADLGVVGEGGAEGVLARIGAQAGRLGELAEAGAQAGPEDASGARDEVADAVGELLFACVDLARRLRCDPELALRAAAARFQADLKDSPAS
jgi:MazG family protein